MTSGSDGLTAYLVAIRRMAEAQRDAKQAIIRYEGAVTDAWAAYNRLSDLERAAVLSPEVPPGGSIGE